VWYGGEGGNSRSRALKLRTLLQRGPAPSYAPLEGDISPSKPLFESHPLSSIRDNVGFPTWHEGLNDRGYWYGGEGGIRTHGRVTPTAVFETARFGRSRTSPFLIVPEGPAGGAIQWLQRIELTVEREIFQLLFFRISNRRCEHFYPSSVWEHREF
jgi:hypothetical protein